MPMPARSPRTVLSAASTALAVLAAALLTALLQAPAAQAADRAVQGGRLDWGIKSSFQSYVTGPIAKGSYSLTQGAATVGASTFRFHSATGSYDGSTGAFRAAFSGGVRFTGHRQAGGGYQLDLTLSRPTVRVAGSSGTLYVDVVSKAKGTGAVTTSSQVPFASLSLAGIDMRGAGTSVALNNLPATLTAQGAKSFAGYYTAGTPLDPVSLSADVRPEDRAPAGAPSSPSPSTPAAPSATAPARKAASGGAIVTGAVDWGVRRTFREYVTGDIARGRWTLSDGAQDGGALFRFPSGAGTFEDGTLRAAFRGTVRFTGAHGLDLRLTGLRVTVEDGRGTLSADVTGTALTGRNVPLVTFTAKGLTARDGLARVTEAPAVLTERGARAFGGMYPAGTAMDPVSVAVALTAGAALPALPDLGTAPTASAQASAAPQAAEGSGLAAEPVAASGHDGGGGFPVLPLVLVAAGVLVVSALGTLIVRGRRRARPAADAAATAEDPAPATKTS
ncbi:HtaA domain-containing protein [Streptomyces sp. SAT1]|uniref:HtaA domain-containing protein n=1 Tax=Streptomyces sp. SAT1 TaxID=1849967 RepID=UPI000AA0C6A0